MTRRPAVGRGRDRLAAAHLGVDDVLFLQRLLGLDEFPPVLALLGNVAYAHEQAAVDDVTVGRLVDAGLLDPHARAEAMVDPHLAAWLRILERPDIEVTLRSVTAEAMRRVVVARRGDDHVLAVRRGDEVVVQGVWSRQRSLDDVVTGPLWAAMRVSETVVAPPPAQLETVTLPLDEVAELAGRTSPGAVSRHLRGEHGVEPATARVLEEVSALTGQRAEIVIREHRGIRTQETAAGVGVADTSHGRVISAVRRQGSRLWVSFGTGTHARFRVAIADLASLTPSRDWFAGRSR